MPKVIELQQQLEAQKTESAARAAQLEADLAAERDKNAQREFSGFLGGDLKRKISPAMMPAALDIMTLLSGIETYEFSAGDDAGQATKIKRPPVEVFREFCALLPDQITFDEVATKKMASGAKTNMTNAQEIAAKAVEFQKTEKEAGRVITITEAVNHVIKT
jgi:hypothetical protein